MTPPLTPHEKKMISEIVEVMKGQAKVAYPPPHVTQRTAHPKNLGIVKANFHVLPNLKSEYQVGLFANVGKTFPCTVRFSSASFPPKADFSPDLRGCAIKLTDFRQDFVLISARTMPLGTPELFYDIIVKGLGGGILDKVKFASNFFFTGKFLKLLEMWKYMIIPSSVLDIPYHSTTPYSFGNTPVQYHLIPKNRPQSTDADSGNKKAARYLFEELKTRLNPTKNNVELFDFCIQFQKQGMPLEDASVIWDEKKSPFIKVAEIEILSQTLEEKENDKLSEEISFSPDHALPEHQLLGSLGKVRAGVYEQMAKFRFERNHHPQSRL